MEPKAIYEFGPFHLDREARILFSGDKNVALTPKAVEVLLVLVEKRGQLVSKDDLMKAVWPDTFVEESNLTANISILRRELGVHPAGGEYIQTISKRGYRFVAAVDLPVQQPTGPGRELSPQSAGVEPRTPWPWRKAGIAAAVLVVLVSGSLWLFRQKPGPYVIAVLPFKNLSSQPDNDYFSDGLTDETIRNLSIIDGLQVRSQTSSFAFKDRPRDIHEVGAQLGANLVVEGSVLRSGDKLRINAQLIRVSDDFPLWAGRFDRELKDVFIIQDEISRSIVNELRLKLGRGQRRYNTNLEAYELYLKARTVLNGPRMRPSIELFEGVIAKDPNFAPAYAGVASAYASVTSQSGDTVISTNEAYAKMRAASEKALQLDPLLAEAYDTMGLVYSRDHAWEEADRAFRRSMQLNPNLADPHVDLALSVLLAFGKKEEALREMRAALRTDPLSPRVHRELAYILLMAGGYDEVLDQYRRIAAAQPDWFASPGQLIGRALLQKGRPAEAIALLEKQPNQGFLGYAYAITGRRAEAEKLAAQNADFPNRQALIYAGLGDKDRTFEALREMAVRKDPRVHRYLLYPELALLNGDPRLPEFRRKIGLP